MIRAVLDGGDTCAALGVTARSSSPVLALCHKLVDAGHDPATPMDVYRGDTLALRIRSIGEAARLRMDTASTGRPVLRRARTTAAASPIREQPEAVA